MSARTFTLGVVIASLVGCETDPRLPVAFDAIELRLTSPSYVYGSGYGVSLAATVMDTRGEERPEVAVTIVPDPTARATTIAEGVQDASFTLEGSGPITFTACIVDDPDVCDQVSLVVDDGRPLLAIDAPTPGQEIDDAGGVYVHGTALDQSPTLQVFVNGALLTVAENGEFSTTLSSRFGVQHIDVLASDALTETARFEMDVLYAGAFTPTSDVGGNPAFTLDDAIGIWLGQDFFDDGVPYDAAVTPIVTRDVADIVELVVANASLSGLIPNPVFSSPAFTLNIPEATLGQPHVELSVQDDGIDLFVRASALSLTTSGNLVVDNEAYPLDGTITGSAVAYVRLGVTKADATSEVDVTLDSLEVAIESVDGDFASADVDAIFTLAAALLRSTIEGFVHDALAGVLSTTVPDLLETVLSGIDHALEDTTLDLGQDPLPPVSLTLNGRMSRIETSYRQHLLAPLSIDLVSDVASVHPGSRGVARLSAAPPPTGFFDAGSAQVGVQLGFLNGVLHVLWSSGLLDLDVKPLLPDFAASIVSEGRLVPRLPPVLRPPREDETSDLVLSIGQLEIELVTQGKTRRFGVKLEAGVDISVADNVITLGVSESPNVYDWENELQEGTQVITADLVATLLTMVWPELRDALVSGLAIELPIPPLPLDGIAPELSGFRLSIGETAARLYPRGELLLLDVSFTGALPTP